MGNILIKGVYKIEKWVKNADAVYYSDILRKNFIFKYEIFQGIYENYQLPTVAKVSLIFFPKKKDLCEYLGSLKLSLEEKNWNPLQWVLGLHDREIKINLKSAINLLLICMLFRKRIIRLYTRMVKFLFTVALGKMTTRDDIIPNILRTF